MRFQPTESQNVSPKSPGMPKTPSTRSSINLSRKAKEKVRNCDSPLSNEIHDPVRAQRETLRAEKVVERDRARAAKERERLEKERERVAKREAAEREKEIRRQQKEEEKRAREEEKRAKEEEKRMRDREREEERAKREEERRTRELEREEERARREEERRAKDEERKRRESEKQREEEEKRRKTEKQRALLMGFFVPSSSSTSGSSDHPKGPFEQVDLKKDQRRAPICRVESEKLRQNKWRNLEALRMSWQSDTSSVIDGSRRQVGLSKFGQPNYLHELRTRQVKPLSSVSTWPVEMPDVLYMGTNVPLQNSASVRYNHGDPGNGGTVWTKAKLLQFVENYRPAYYGTWRRRSYVIKGRRPFARDYLQLDYEVDSDDEWEEEEPGESISQSGDEEEEDLDDEEDEDAKFLVPHGYLSDDEGVHDEEGDANEGGCGADAADHDFKRLRQRLSLAEYETAHRRGLQKLQPLLLGPIWYRDPIGGLQDVNEDTNKVDGAEDDYLGLEDNKENNSGAKSAEDNNTATSILASREQFGLMRSVLSAYKVFLWHNRDLPISTKCGITSDQPGSSAMTVAAAPAAASATSQKTPSSVRQKKKFPDEAVPYLIRLIHKSNLSRAKLQFEFRVFWQQRVTKEEVPAACRVFRDFRDTRNVGGGAPTTSAETKDDAFAPTTPHLRRACECPVASAPAINLLLSKTQTMAKIGEIAVFEEGQWRVRPDILLEHKASLLAPRDLPEIFESILPITDLRFSFPAWSFLTDVNCGLSTTAAATSSVSKRGAVRKSLHAPSSTPSPSSCSRVPKLALATTPRSGEKTPPSRNPRKSMKMSPSAAAVGGGKRRATLESFFGSPPGAKKAKRESPD